MARGRSAPAPASRSSSAAASRPRPAAQPQSAPAAHQAPHPTPAAHPHPTPAAQPHHAPPPPMAAPAAAAPPAVQSSGGGGILSGLMGSVVTGAAMGTGSALASRAIDSFMGPRTVVHQHEGAPAAAPVSSSDGMDPCISHTKAFSECMSKNNDMAMCQYYFDAMQQCKIHA
uniref:CHCH domain-containing protein n=1 Tax=Polytomella parva TaxID=51329 RepID=A0A7S0YJP9_9CHLO|mmetsp:Transcript_32752/g.59353  ORF Transcript_32752/g.59353 Transcript_32752/m.59353 type:complete len:172 (+) Transcript_32752:88-603(+)|eukprot:CAMPEP_0175058300 /NCGR_PEP_ID=MMETSP0052_2-20121109/11771_1 /TAXON_ID=51329 ORGANISM="Polytomella parva, Strain SAG 63-3" /NCGR_SAMPLE_ID=MMETSP0052_2 /ASSEMBLY_ACC=CAM_ASM_000194 /LENGTH=171 /DNA_ID=CAMNT_0016323665 /DNA_START=61 /DNA_END=576 /DNA_ORIENTATION=-